MIKNVSHISSRIICPKCQNKTLRKSVGSINTWNNVEKEYFCDHCHEYFGIGELVNKWGYDLGDFGDTVSVNYKVYIEYHLSKIIVRWWDSDTVSPTYEPDWNSFKERISDYDTVTEMLLGIPAWESNDIDYGSPILQVGMC